MEPVPQEALSDLHSPVQEAVARLAGLPEVRAAFDRFRAQEPQFALWQMEATRVAAPPFGESARGLWLADRFRELGLIDVQVDEVGNVFGIHPPYLPPEPLRYLAIKTYMGYLRLLDLARGR